MLRKRTRSHQKDQNMGQLNSDVSESYFHSDFLVHKHKNNSFFNAPGLFVGFNPKASESDSVRSPTSPLDFRLFSSFGNPFRSPRSYHEGHHKIWDSNKVGLSIIDSLDHEDKQLGKVLRASESKNILFGPQMRIKTLKSPMHTDSLEEPKSLPKNIGIFPYNIARPSGLQKGSSDVLFEIGDAPSELEPSFRPCSLDSGRSGLRLGRLAKNNSYLGSRSFVCENGRDLVPSAVKIAGGSKLSNMSDAEQHSVRVATGSSNGLIGTLPPSEIELSEDYTCVRIHGPNPKVTHIFGDCILECHNNKLTNFGKNNEDDGMILPQTAECSEAPVSYPANDFLSSCYSCKKKLDGEDIYMYRGEKAFCSWNCRLQEILIDEEVEETNNNNTNAEDIASPSSPEEHSEPSLFAST